MRTRILWTVVLVSALCSACGGKVLSPVGEMDTGTDSGSEDMDSGGALVRVDVMPDSGAGTADIVVPASSNPEGVQGYWYPFANAESGMVVTEAGADRICVSGQLMPAANGWAFGGLGFAPCYSDGEWDPAYTQFALADCPFVPDLVRRLVGVSFSLTGTVPEGLRLEAREVDDVQPAYILLAGAGSGDYFFDDMTLQYEGDILVMEQVQRIQVILNSTADPPPELSFCIEDMRLLLTDD
jgi:hypothetical protein